MAWYVDRTVAREVIWEGDSGGGLGQWLWSWFGKLAWEVI